MSRLSSPLSDVPTLTNVVNVPTLSEPADPSSNETATLSRELQKKVVRRVVRRIGKTLKARLRNAGQHSSADNRDCLTASLRGEIESAVGDAVDQAFAQQTRQDAVRLKNRQIRAKKTPLKAISQKVTSY